MDTAVDIVGNGETGAPDIPLQKTAADPVVYQLVRVDVDGRLVPATQDELMAFEELLEDDKNKSGTQDAGQSFECSTSYGCQSVWAGKARFIGSEGKPNLELMQAAESEEVNVQHEEMIASLIPDITDGNVVLSGVAESKNSNSPLGVRLKPDFSLLNGEIDLDNLSVKVLQETFKAAFGRETSVKDKLWLKRRIIMGLTNSCDFSTTTLVLIDNRVVKKGKEETRKTTDCSVSVDFVATSEVECHEKHACTDKQNGKDTVANGMQSQSCFQEIKDADPGQIPAKRVRKPTKRYIEEFSEGEFRDSGAKIVSLVKHDSKPSSDVCERPVHDFGLDGRCLLREDSLGGSGIQVPFVSRIRRSRPRENFMTLMKLQPSGFELSGSLEENGVSSCKELESERENKVLKSSMSPRWTQEPVVASSERRKSYMEKKTIQHKRDSHFQNMRPYITSSDDEVDAVPTASGGMRRKHHRPWSLSEVVKLVEGVAKYGAGRWSEIKRFAFSSYSYRTSVDLKDKWRNLLRASLAEPLTGNGIPIARKQALIPIPAPILSRVRELADMQTQVTPILSSGRLPGSLSFNKAA